MKKLIALIPLWVLAYIVRPWFFHGSYSVNDQVTQTFEVMLGLVVVPVVLLVLFARAKFKE